MNCNICRRKLVREIHICLKVCRFCPKRESTKHLCAKMYIYEYIFKQLFLRLFFHYKPKDYLDFFCLTMRYINKYSLFSESSSPGDVVRENLIHFLQEYDCF